MKACDFREVYTEGAGIHWICRGYSPLVGRGPETPSWVGVGGKTVVITDRFRELVAVLLKAFILSQKNGKKGYVLRIKEWNRNGLEIGKKDESFEQLLPRVGSWRKKCVAFLWSLESSVTWGHRLYYDAGFLHVRMFFSVDMNVFIQNMNFLRKAYGRTE